MAIGIVILTLIISVGMPVINKMKDRHTLIQTEEMMLSLDGVVRSVYNQGPGAQDVVNLEVSQGNLDIDNSLEIISWEMDTTALLSEPGVTVEHGNMILETTEHGNTYHVKLSLDYSTTAINITYNGFLPISGKHRISIQNAGSNELHIVDLS
jgi:hypothetical protein